MRGFFRMDYQGTVGTGAGALAFVDGKVAGLDTGGGQYKGTYQESGSHAKGEVMMDFPQGGKLVTGHEVPAGAPPQRIPFEIEGNPSGQIIKLTTPTGPVNVRLTKISDL